MRESDRGHRTGARIERQPAVRRHVVDATAEADSIAGLLSSEGKFSRREIEREQIPDDTLAESLLAGQIALEGVAAAAGSTVDLAETAVAIDPTVNPLVDPAASPPPETAPDAGAL